MNTYQYVVNDKVYYVQADQFGTGFDGDGRLYFWRDLGDGKREAVAIVNNFAWSQVRKMPPEDED